MVCAVGKMTDEVCSELDNVSASTNFIAALTSYVMLQAETIANDAEAFAGHRGSKTIETKDVLLCTRKNDLLHELLKESIDDFAKKQQQRSKDKR